MERIDEFVDNRQKAWCIHCSKAISEHEVSKDHVPTKSLLVKPRPDHLPVVTICRECNNSFSRDEQYAVTFLSCVLAGSTDPDKQSNPSASRALSKSRAMRTAIEKTKRETRTHGGLSQTEWQPDMERIGRVILKNARGHIYFEYGEPRFEPPLSVRAIPLQIMSEQERADFEGLEDVGGLAGWPEVGSRMTTRIVSGVDMEGEWVIVQGGVYRYSVDGHRVKTVIWEYLATEVLWAD